MVTLEFSLYLQWLCTVALHLMVILLCSLTSDVDTILQPCTWFRHHGVAVHLMLTLQCNLTFDTDRTMMHYIWCWHNNSQCSLTSDAYSALPPDTDTDSTVKPDKRCWLCIVALHLVLTVQGSIISGAYFHICFWLRRLGSITFHADCSIALHLALTAYCSLTSGSDSAV